MHVINIFFATFLFILCISNVSAQTTYNQVTLDRGKDDETNCIYIHNENLDSVFIFIQYKIGNRETEWIDFPVPNKIPPTVEPLKIGCVDSTIIGLKLVDVMILRDSNTKKTTQNDNSFKQIFKSIFK